MVTKEEWDALDKKIEAFDKFKARRDHNKMLVDRVKGISAKPATPESDIDPQNPNR